MKGHILGGRYELIEKIGGGGMAVVYKAKCRLLNRFVAVKILRPEFNNDEEFINRFRIEAQAAASLSHPNIVSIYDVGEEEGIHYIVMEFIDGITLKDYIKKRGMIPWREATNIAIQICSAIEQAHRNHIVHRDIKPHNIILTADGIAKVTDFGIAKAVTSSTITMAGSTIGSVHYFSPEQARGGFVDEKSDIYSLGIVLYEMVTGRTPFDGETPVAVALKHIQSVPEEPSSINPNIPRSVNDIIMKAMKKEQSCRYQTATEMLADLHRVFKEPDGDFVVFSNDDNCPTVRIRDIANRNFIPKEEESDIRENKANKGKNRKDNLTTWLAIATSVIIISIFAYIGYRIIMPVILPPSTENFTVDNYVGKNIDEVRELLEKHNIIVEEKPVFSETKEKGTIISQSIAPGKEFKPGAANVIEFEVSAGPEMIKIPDLKKKEYRVAETDLKNMGLKTDVVEENSDTIPNGYVIRTEPGEDEEVEPGTLVTIFKSIGPKLEQVQVPNLIGKTFSEVQRELDSAKLKIGKIKPENMSSSVAKVIEQYPLANTVVDEGTAVDITFGDGNEQEEETESGGDQNDPGNENDNTGEEVLKRKTVFQYVPLAEPKKYGEEIKVYAVATLSDNNEKRVIFHRTVKKSEFPLRLSIPVPEGGKTEVRMELDGEFYTEFFVE